MRPTPIPDNEIMAGHTRQVIGPPANCDHLDGPIRPVEALVAVDTELNVRIFRFRIILEDGDLEQLEHGDPIWLTFWSHVVPWDIGIVP